MAPPVTAFFKHLFSLLQYILSGSDDFNLYMWKIPKDPEAGELSSRGFPLQVRFGCYVLFCSCSPELRFEVSISSLQPGRGNVDVFSHVVLPSGGPGRVVNGAFMVLKGHRSIVNQVRFNPHSYMICSSGVEKVIKVSRRADVCADAGWRVIACRCASVSCGAPTGSPTAWATWRVWWRRSRAACTPTRSTSAWC